MLFSIFSLVTRYGVPCFFFFLFLLMHKKLPSISINIPLRKKKIWISSRSAPQSSIYPFTYLQLFPLCSSSTTDVATQNCGENLRRQKIPRKSRRPPPHITHSKPHDNDVRHNSSRISVALMVLPAFSLEIQHLLVTHLSRPTKNNLLSNNTHTESEIWTLHRILQLPRERVGIYTRRCYYILLYAVGNVWKLIQKQITNV